MFHHMFYVFDLELIAAMLAPREKIMVFQLFSNDWLGLWRQSFGIN